MGLSLGLGAVPRLFFSRRTWPQRAATRVPKMGPGIAYSTWSRGRAITDFRVHFANSRVEALWRGTTAKT